MKSVEVEGFDFFAGPRGAAEEFEAGFDRGVGEEAVDADAVAEFGPAEFVDEFGEDLFEFDAVERVVGGVGRHC